MNKMLAIKTLRGETGLGLKEVKDRVEVVTDLVANLQTDRGLTEAEALALVSIVGKSLEAFADTQNAVDRLACSYGYGMEADAQRVFAIVAASSTVSDPVAAKLAELAAIPAAPARAIEAARKLVTLLGPGVYAGYRIVGDIVYNPSTAWNVAYTGAPDDAYEAFGRALPAILDSAIEQRKQDPFAALLAS